MFCFTFQRTLLVLLPILCLMAVNVAFAQTHIVNTVISLSKTGSETFDASRWTGDRAGGVNVGQDANEDDNILRLQDSITYRVEVSVNDGDVGSLSNSEKLMVMTQCGCWNMYYVDPVEDSMGHRFMVEGDRGAVSVIGANTLTKVDN